MLKVNEVYEQKNAKLIYEVFPFRDSIKSLVFFIQSKTVFIMNYSIINYAVQQIQS